MDLQHKQHLYGAQSSGSYPAKPFELGSFPTVPGTEWAPVVHATPAA